MARAEGRQVDAKAATDSGFASKKARKAAVSGRRIDAKTARDGALASTLPQK